jgi:hypothetical protein
MEEDFSYAENPYHAFPLEMRGRYCEFEDKGRTRFIEIYNIKFDKNEVNRLIKIDCLKESVLGSYLALLKGHVLNENSDIFFLYKLITYIANPSIKDAWYFNESIEDYAEYGFTKFATMMNLCINKWNISLKDFVPREETNIP